MPDGTLRAEKGRANPDSKVSPDDNSHDKKDTDEKEEKLTKKQIYALREDVIDKALISAVKTLAQLQRAQDLMAYSRHPRI